jgi:hypothetical protein
VFVHVSQDTPLVVGGGGGAIVVPFRREEIVLVLEKEHPDLERERVGVRGMCKEHPGCCENFLVDSARTLLVHDGARALLLVIAMAKALLLWMDSPIEDESVSRFVVRKYNANSCWSLIPLTHIGET